MRDPDDGFARSRPRDEQEPREDREACPATAEKPPRKKRDQHAVHTMDQERGEAERFGRESKREGIE